MKCSEITGLTHQKTESRNIHHKSNHIWRDVITNRNANRCHAVESLPRTIESSTAEIRQTSISPVAAGILREVVVLPMAYHNAGA